MVWKKLNGSSSTLEYFIASREQVTWLVVSILVVDQSSALNTVTLKWSRIPQKLIRLESKETKKKAVENEIIIKVQADDQKGVPMRATPMQWLEYVATGDCDIFFDVVEARLSEDDLELLELAIISDVLTGTEDPFQRIVETDDN